MAGTDAGMRRQRYTLYAATGRVYASNVDQKIIDLGPLTRDGASFSYELEGNHLSGSGLFTEEEALRDIASRLHFLWIDGQFTALADVRPTVDLSQAKRLDIELDELGPNERITDATV